MKGEGNKRGGETGWKGQEWCVCGGGEGGETAREMERQRGRERRERKEGEENDLSAL